MDEKFRFVCEATCSSGDGLRYKWFKGGNEIPGETKNILEKCVLHTHIHSLHSRVSLHAVCPAIVFVKVFWTLFESWPEVLILA